MTAPSLPNPGPGAGARSPSKYRPPRA